MVFLRIFLILLLLCSPAFGQSTYFVQTGGNDSAAGSEAAPWANCPGMEGWGGTATLSNGDTVNFDRSNTWEGTDMLFVVSAAGVTYCGNCWGSGTGRAEFKVTSRTSSTGPVHIRRSTTVFKGFKVNNNNHPICGISVGYAEGPDANISDITISDNEVTGGPVDDGNIVTSPFDGLKYRAMCDQSVYDCTLNTRPGDGVDWDHWWDLYSGTRESQGTWLTGQNYHGRNWYYGIHISSLGTYTVSNVLVENNYVHDVGHEGIPIYPQTSAGARVYDITIRGNRIVNTGTGRTTLKNVVTGEYTRQDYVERQTCIDAVNNSDNVTIEFNYCENGGSVSIGSYNYVGVGSPDNYIVRYNIFNGTSFTLSALTPFDYYGYGAFYGNIIINGGINGWGGKNFRSTSQKFYNNIIYNTTAAHGLYHLGACSNQENVEFKNNIIYINYGSAGIYNIKDQGDCMLGVQHSNNLYYRSTGTTVIDGGVSDYTTTTVCTVYETTGCKYNNPTFTGGTLPTGFTGTYQTDMVPNTEYFKITNPTSAALNNGATLGSPYNGNINTAGRATPNLRPEGKYDIGAYEYFGNLILNTGPAGLAGSGPAFQVQ